MIFVDVKVNGIPVKPCNRDSEAARERPHWHASDIEEILGRPVGPADQCTVEVRNEPGFYSSVVPEWLLR